jgi:beta-glucosidase
VTFLEGIRNKVGPETKVIYAEGCDHTTVIETDGEGKADRGFAEALAAVEQSDAVIMCMGLSPDIEGEETLVDQCLSRLKGLDKELIESVMPPEAIKWLDSAAPNGCGDRLSLELPGVQTELLKRVSLIGKPMVLVLANGSPVAINWEHANIPAIIEAWYPGEEGGTALADILFGDYSLAGRLPVTFVKSCEQLPPFDNYAMKGRTYRYLDQEPLYPFGYGLNYTEFRYSNLSVSNESIVIGNSLVVRIDVKNCGEMAGDEVVQLYLTAVDALPKQMPKYELKGFLRISLQPGQEEKVEFQLTSRQMAFIDDQGICRLEPGVFRVFVGGQQPDRRSQELTGRNVLETEFTLTGNGMEVAY